MGLNHRFPSALISLVVLMFISRLDSEITPQPGLKEMAKADMQQLMTLVRYTGDLYHELHALDRFEQDYRRKLEEEKRSVTFETGISMFVHVSPL